MTLTDERPRIPRFVRAVSPGSPAPVDETPVLPAYRDGPRGPDAYGQLLVWCRGCERFHRHAAYGEFGESDGHRAPHCYLYNDKSPYRRNGYVLVEVGDFTDEVRKLYGPERRGRMP